MMSQEKKKVKIKYRIRFCLMPEGMSTHHVHGALYITTCGGDLWSGRAGAEASVWQHSTKLGQ